MILNEDFAGITLQLGCIEKADRNANGSGHGGGDGGGWGRGRSATGERQPHLC